MTRALYRKYRSKSLADVVGQSHITDILARALKEGRVAHAYLFTGPRGVGKTSVARILAHEINQLPYSDDSTHLDIIEIDAASNNGVDDIRDLRDKVQLAPVSAAKKVYIIDEVHMLSKAAFNALLKTLEEPPEHVVFILATTDADKLPATIVSRTQRFGFRTIPVSDAVRHLRFIADQEKLTVTDEALELIAAHGDGSFRDSISLLDQLRSVGAEDGITRELVEASLGLPPADLVEQVIEAYEAKDLGALVQLLDTAEHAGIQPSALTGQLIRATRSRLAEKPQFMQLLDSLLEVQASSHPAIKLLTVLGASAHAKVKTAALASPAPVISAPPAALKRQTPKVKIEASQEEPKDTAPILPVTKKPVKAASTSDSSVGEIPATIDWDKVIEYTRAHHIAIYTVLSKCTHELSGSTLIIYTGNSFYKKKLDDVKYKTALAASLAEIGMGNPAIEIVGSAAPPKDAVAAAVAAVMGGGQEIILEEGEG
jgi:DNA polymerase-3 subunit gamma/tau